MTSYVKAIALDDVDAARKGDLSFKKGDEIFIIKKATANIWRGATKDGKVGRFLARMVEEVKDEKNEAETNQAKPSNSQTTSTNSTASSSTTSTNNKTATQQAKPKYSKAIALDDCDAARTGDLAFKKGDTILVLNKSSPNIWRGASNGKVGRFLARLVKELPLNDAKPAANASESTTSTATPSNATKPAEKQYETCRAIDDCEAARRGDLAFKKGDVITILSKGSPNIWKGAVNGKVGRFLARLVEPIQPPSKQPEPTTTTTNAVDTPNDTSDVEQTFEVVALEDSAVFDPEDLPFMQGEIIVVTKKLSRGVWFGKIGPKREGKFLARLVEPKDSNAQQAVGEIELNTSVTFDKPFDAIAVEDSIGAGSDHLSFARGSKITIFSQPSPGVYEGEVGGKRGRFLSRLVKKLDEDANNNNNNTTTTTTSTTTSSPDLQISSPPPSTTEPTTDNDSLPRTHSLPPKHSEKPPLNTSPSRHTTALSKAELAASDADILRRAVTTNTASSSTTVGKPMPAAALMSNAHARPKSVFLLPTMFQTQSEDEFKHNMIANELYTTEASYVEDLEIMLEEYFQPLCALSAVPDDSVLRVLHKAVDQLVPLHKTLSHSLELAMRRSLSLARPLSGLSGGVFLNLYKDYCASYNDAFEALRSLAKNNKCRKVLDDAERRKRCRNLQFEDFLIKPVQRLCKYPLLVKQLVALTPEDSVEHQQLTAALAKLTSAVDLVNEHKRNLESDNAAELYQKALILIHTGQYDLALSTLVNVVAKKPKDPGAQYSIACAHSLKGDVTLAHQHLGLALDYGYGNIKSLRDDTALATARAHEDWATIFVRKIRAEGEDDEGDAYIKLQRKIAKGESLSDESDSEETTSSTSHKLNARDSFRRILHRSNTTQAVRRRATSDGEDDEDDDAASGHRSMLKARLALHKSLRQAVEPSDGYTSDSGHTRRSLNLRQQVSPREIVDAREELRQIKETLARTGQLDPTTTKQKRVSLQANALSLSPRTSMTQKTWSARRFADTVPRNMFFSKKNNDNNTDENNINDNEDDVDDAATMPAPARATIADAMQEPALKAKDGSKDDDRLTQRMSTSQRVKSRVFRRAKTKPHDFSLAHDKSAARLSTREKQLVELLATSVLADTVGDLPQTSSAPPASTSNGDSLFVPLANDKGDDSHSSSSNTIPPSNPESMSSKDKKAGAALASVGSWLAQTKEKAAIKAKKFAEERRAPERSSVDDTATSAHPQIDFFNESGTRRRHKSRQHDVSNLPPSDRPHASVLRDVERLRRTRIGLLAEVSHIESSSQGRPKTEAELQVLVDCQLELTSVNEELEKHRATLPPHLQHMIDEAPRNELLLSDDDDDDDDAPAARRHARHARLNSRKSSSRRRRGHRSRSHRRSSGRILIEDEESSSSEEKPPPPSGLPPYAGNNRSSTLPRPSVPSPSAVAIKKAQLPTSSLKSKLTPIAALPDGVKPPPPPGTPIVRNNTNNNTSPDSVPPPPVPSNPPPAQLSSTGNRRKRNNDEQQSSMPPPAPRTPKGSISRQASTPSSNRKSLNASPSRSLSTHDRSSSSRKYHSKSKKSSESRTSVPSSLLAAGFAVDDDDNNSDE